MIKGYKCYFCKKCDGRGCKGQIPGMGGVFKSANFLANCADWKKYHIQDNFLDKAKEKNTEKNIIDKNSMFVKMPKLRLAPMTGAMQNVGCKEEEPFYLDLINFSIRENLLLSIGDGHPDDKLRFGIEALQKVNRKGAVFFKPYPQAKLFERSDWAMPVAEIIGVDIDSYNIVTMRNQVSLEKKTAKDLDDLRKYTKLPVAVKGIFTQADIELVKELKPEIAIISNHGGRIETELGSTADFTAKHASTLAKYADQVWVDGGLRCKADVLAAGRFGISEVMIGRPCITQMLANGNLKEFF